YRKRAEREKNTLRQMGTFDVLKDSLGVIDNLERALESGGDVEDLKQGLRLILRQQEEFLRRYGVERIDTEGQLFDPTIHEAVARQELAEVEAPTVVGEFQKGYLFHDRLLRPAMVHVAMPAAVAKAAAAEAAEENDESSPEEPRSDDREVEEVTD
ncbi:MAG: nucleotide exchange factor GrpE, partial [Thermoanaerobaculia bacterium]